jgi:hypothetical protein
VDNRKLIIDGTRVPLSEGEAIPITKSIIDIKEPWNRKSDFSKEFLLPASKEANIVFSHIFDVNIDTQFNPNLKLDATYTEGSEIIVEGFVRMLNIVETDDKEIFYQIQLLGSLSNIFREFGDKELDDSGMLWGELDHTYDRTRQQNSWATSYQLNGAPQAFALGEGYVYGMVDYGRHQNVNTYDVQDLFPQTYEREVLLRMFTDAGYSWNSTFLDGSTFRKCVITNNRTEALGVTAAQVTARLFEANTPLVVSSGLNTLSVVQSNNVITFVPEVLTNSVEVVDPANAHNTTTGIWIPPSNGYYNLSESIDITATLTPTGAANTTVMNGNVQIFVTIQRKVTGGSWTTIANNAMYISAENIATIGYTTTGTTYPDDEYSDGLQSIAFAGALTVRTSTARNYNPPKTLQTGINNVFLETTTQVRTLITTNWFRDKLYDPAGTAYGLTEGWFIDETDNTVSHDGTVSLTLTAGTFKNSVSNPQVLDGNTLNYVDVLPKKVKQKDFFKGIINKFNLFIQPDEDDPSILNIEPRNDFYTDDIIDWSTKWDKSLPKNSRPMGALDAKEYDYTYTPDKDYYNEDYTKEYERVYANREFEVSNDFETKTATTKVIFAPTPSTGFTNSDRVVPQIIKIDNQLNISPIDSRIRTLFYGGLKANNVNWNHTSLGSNDFQATYPYVGMWDDPYNPTETLDFGIPRKIYWKNTFQAINATNNNLFNKYYKQYIEEITDKNSRIVTAWFALTTNDVKTADFKKLFWWDNAYFRLNKIMDYKQNKLTQCEFLKLNFADPFVLNIVELINGKGETIGDETLPIFQSKIQIDNNIYNPKSGTVEGDNNIVDDTASGVDVKGDNNHIGVDAKSITIVGDGNIIGAGSENVTLINTNNTTILESNVTYIDGIAQSGSSVVLQKSVDFIAELGVTTYEVDTSAGNVTVILDGDDTPEGKVWIIKKVSSAYTITVNGSKGYTIDLAISGTIISLNDATQFQFNGETNFNSI